VLSGKLSTDLFTVLAGQYFCLTSNNNDDIIVNIEENSNIVLIERVGFKGQNVVGGPLERSGRLVYIDGCSDSLLVYPPRQGDPSLNALFFPPHIEQSYHIHPSIRLGVVISGNGVACLKKGAVNETEITLHAGTVFCIEERESHRFRTDDDSMVVIAFHPDGDWGPTDHNHTMLNRTYIQKK
jgi:quercetin dioxygenase-like cupin family protein